MKRVSYIINLLIIYALLAAVAIRGNGRVAGVDVDDIFSSNEESEQDDSERMLGDGTRVITTTILGKGVLGYSGTTPVELYVKDGVVQRVELLPNSETPSFLMAITSTPFMSYWDGMSLQEAAAAAPDAVSGSTMSSYAISKNVQLAAQWAADVPAKSGGVLRGFGVKEVSALLVIALGIALTFFKGRKKWMVMLQHSLNVVVLGFWCGSFLSLSQIVGWVSNGVNLSVSILSLALLAVAIVVPLFGRKGTYCYLHCPMGAAQALMGEIPLKKFKISPNVVKWLNSLRYYIFSALLLVMWLGFGFEIMDYELFSAFVVSNASPVVIVLALLFLLLSIFIPRPYCRFICPTGAMITTSQMDD